MALIPQHAEACRDAAAFMTAWREGLAAGHVDLVVALVETWRDDPEANARLVIGLATYATAILRFQEERFGFPASEMLSQLNVLGIED